MGQYEAPEELYLQAINLLTVLCAEDSKQLDYRRWLVEALRKLGDLYHVNGQTSRAEPMFEQAIGQARVLLSGAISTPYRRATSPAFISLAEVYILKTRYDQARETADQAIELLKPIALGEQKSRQATRDRWLYCLALTARGIASDEAGDHRAAAHDFDEAWTLADSYSDPKSDYYDDLQFQLACIDNCRGKVAEGAPYTLAEAESALEPRFFNA